MTAREVSRFAGLSVAAWLLALIVVGITAALIWGVRVMTSEVRGEGDALVTKNSAANWTAAQARFEEMYAEVVATDRKIAAARAAVDAAPGDRTAQQTYAGLVSYCISVVGDYNAAARSYLSEDFRAADLPAQIGTADPDTNCQE